LWVSWRLTAAQELLRPGVWYPAGPARLLQSGERSQIDGDALDLPYLSTPGSVRGPPGM
jgi:hypothetical protein